ncbi:GNAT family N-acetyltransferase [Candidatus Saccharibacteria bacterium]|nr:GNAT family N-acetyltransferase [Candidatus Saccharibacteria bacterium]MBI3337782.1 GNAT family N-acetyltransferase [Candidatus Saccharibacteria bacterium]
MAEVKLYRPEELEHDEWRQLQSIERDAFVSTLDRTQAEIDALIEWDDPAHFTASHVDPNTEVGKRYNANQSYSHSRVAVATKNREPIGFAYSAHNVSGGSEQNRLVKRLTVVKNYLWLREVAVKPEHQRQGLARELGRTLLKDAIGLQPVAAYVWPDEDPDFLQGTLERLGFSPTGEQQVKVFGENSEPIRQVRMQAPSARAVLRNLG